MVGVVQGFNSNGWLKSKITPSSGSWVTWTTDACKGMYVKKREFSPHPCTAVITHDRVLSQKSNFLACIMLQTHIHTHTHTHTHTHSLVVLVHADAACPDVPQGYLFVPKKDSAGGDLAQLSRTVDVDANALKCNQAATCKV